MHNTSDQKDQRLRQKQVLRQKQTLRFVIAGSIIVLLTSILIIYINLTKVNEIKAIETVATDSLSHPSDLNVTKVLVVPAKNNSSEGNYKIAKPLQRDTVLN